MYGVTDHWPAVHCAWKKQYGTWMLLCVNTIDTAVEAAITAPADSKTEWRDYFAGGKNYGCLEKFEFPFKIKANENLLPQAYN